MNKAISSHGAFPHGIMPSVDLHVHSNRSDGTLSPSQLVDYAIEKGLAAFALTDHDTIDGLEEAITYAESLKSPHCQISSALSAKQGESASTTAESINATGFNSITESENTTGFSTSTESENNSGFSTSTESENTTGFSTSTESENTTGFTTSTEAENNTGFSTIAESENNTGFSTSAEAENTTGFNSSTEPDNTESKANIDPAISISAAISHGCQEFVAERQCGTRIPYIPEVIPGIEFSTEYQGQDVHIVGLYIDYHNKAFLKQLQEFVDSRESRNKKMCQLLQAHGIQMTYEDLLTEFPDAVITRAHYAKYMLSHGYIKSMKEAFERYIDDHGPCYVPREKVTPEQAVKLILAADGIPILAHPILYHMSDERLDTLTATLKKAGLVGIEAIYSTYTPAEERQIRALADKYNLLISGGSDFHGTNKPGLDLAVGYGKLFVPYSVLLNLKKIRSSSSNT